MLSVGARRGDTIIEVMLAFAVFASLAVTVTYLMNRSIATAQRSLEITLVRQQIDTQADLLRYARDNDTSDTTTAWDVITTNTYTGLADQLTNALTSCPGNAGVVPASSRSFFMNLDSSGGVARHALTASNFGPAAVSSTVILGATPQAQGLWVTAVHAQGSNATSTTKAYDMYIRACWDTVGQSVPLTLSTIVRLYDT